MKIILVAALALGLGVEQARAQITPGAPISAAQLNALFASKDAAGAAAAAQAYATQATNLTGTLPTARLPALTGGDATTAAASGAITLNTVTTAGSFPKVSFNAKGLITAGGPLSLGDVTTGLGYTPLNKAGDVMLGNLSLQQPIGGLQFVLNTVATGQGEQINLQDAGLTSWTVSRSASADNLIFGRYINGVYQDAPFQISNATGQAIVTNPFTNLGANTASISSDASRDIVQNSAISAQAIYAPVLPSGSYENDGKRTTMVIPAGSVGQTNGFGFYGRNYSQGAQGVGVWGIMECLATGASCWDLNPTITDTYDNTVAHSYATSLIGAEFDFSVYNAGTNICGVCLTGSTATQPIGADGFVVGDLHASAPGVVKWSHGFVVNDGVSPIGWLIGALQIGSVASKSAMNYMDYKVSGAFTEYAATMQAGTSGDTEFSNTNSSNGIALFPTPAGGFPTIQPFGTDTNIALVLAGTGTAPVIVQSILDPNKGIINPNYTVANLPACTSAMKGLLMAVSDASGTPTYNGAVTGGGSTSLPVYCNGSGWTQH